MLSWRYLFICLASAHLAGCAVDLSSNEEPKNCEMSGDQYGIIGGRPLGTANDLSASTVLVRHTKSDGSEVRCTGTLIGDNTVLTAAHCLSTFGTSTRIAFTNNSSCASAAADRVSRKVTNSAIHYKYLRGLTTLSNASYDLAVLRFSGKIPEGFKARELPAANFQQVAGEDFITAGFGWQDESGDKTGELHYLKLSSDKLKSQFYLTLVGSDIRVTDTWIFEQYNGGVCSGDSGGPLYVKTAKGLMLVGITSMGVDDRATSIYHRRACMGMSLFTDIRSHLDWIHEKKNSL